jgi:Xaa-Pro aminopeptidase
MNLEAIQAALRSAGWSGWLFVDHHERDPIAYRVLGFRPVEMMTRRWYYYIPAEGEPRKLVHRIESRMLDALPGETNQYAGWREQRTALAAMLGAGPRPVVAMQYSPECAIPYVSMVDAGTVELVRSLGVEVVSSADLVQLFEAAWTAAQFDQHLRAGRKVDAIRAAAFARIAAAHAAGRTTGEFEIQTFIRESFDREGLFTDHGPVVAVNANASNPHYEPSAERHFPIAPGDFVLIDLWAKLREPAAVYYDITWTGVCAAAPPPGIERVFAVVREARDAAVARAHDGLSRGEIVRGQDVDDAARGVITAAGFGPAFFHRTGHSIGEDVHGTGANMDNLETGDDRAILANTCFSVEPGIYLPEFGVRSEVNVFAQAGGAIVTGERQESLVRIV